MTSRSSPPTNTTICYWPLKKWHAKTHIRRCRTSYLMNIPLSHNRQVMKLKFLFLFVSHIQKHSSFPWARTRAWSGGPCPSNSIKTFWLLGCSSIARGKHNLMEFPELYRSFSELFENQIFHLFHYTYFSWCFFLQLSPSAVAAGWVLSMYIQQVLWIIHF